MMRSTICAACKISHMSWYWNVSKRVQTQNDHKIVADTASYCNRTRITGWLLYRAQVRDHRKQEHSYYTAAKKFTLSPVKVMTLTDQEAHQRIERYCTRTQVSPQSGLYTAGTTRETAYSARRQDGTN